MSNNIENKLQILVVEDSDNIIEGLEYLLNKEGFKVTIVKNIKEATTEVDSNKYDLFLLDVQLPDGSGFDLIKYIKSKMDLPVIFISGRGEEINIVYGLDLGADDYVVKPFRNNELISRIKCILRRYNMNAKSKNIIKYKNLEIDLDQQKVFKNDEEIFLSKVEFKLLTMFISNPNKLIKREQILEQIWDIDGNFVNDNTLTVYIKRLRLKIGDNDENKMIKTVRGVRIHIKQISD